MLEAIPILGGSERIDELQRVLRLSDGGQHSPALGVSSGALTDHGSLDLDVMLCLQGRAA